ncbi:MAG: DUF2062 domain-containing protein [Bacillaceae bacterium]|nr:DUF2062 domain-containing protein [Bacillaceae bacterium]
MKRGIKYNLIRLFRIKRGAHQIALGITVGFIPGWFPTFGFGAIFSVILARLVGGSIVASLISGTSVTFVWPFLYYFNYKIGNLVLNKNRQDATVESVNDVDSFSGFTSWRDIGLDFMIGAVINTIFFGLLMYTISYWLFKKYRGRILQNLRRKER